MTFTSPFAAMFDDTAFGTDELPGWSHPSRNTPGTGVQQFDFLFADDLPGWSRPLAEAAA